MKKNQKFVKIMAMVMAVLMLLSLLISVIPVYAHADVTQDDINALKAQKSELSARVQDCKERLELLQGQQESVLLAKAALVLADKAEFHLSGVGNTVAVLLQIILIVPLIGGVYDLNAVIFLNIIEFVSKIVGDCGGIEVLAVNRQ